MITVYFFPGTRSTRVLWALEEAGAGYELARVDLLEGEGLRPPYIEINPTGKVPTLVDGELVLPESAAICTYVGDRFPDSGLTPVHGTPERAQYLRWAFFVIGELEQPLWTMTKHQFALPEKLRVPAIMDTARWEFARAARSLAAGLGVREYLVAERFTAADILVAHTLAWARSVELPLERDNLESYADRMLARPALARAREREQA